MSSRVAIFIDSNNLRGSLNGTFNNHKIDFEVFTNKLCAGRKLVRTYFYIPLLPERFNVQKAREQQRFLSMIRQTPYLTVRRGRLVQRSNAWTEKGIDVRIASDMITYAYRDHYDVAILVSGDSDFEEVVKAVQETGRHVENAIARSGCSNLLRDTCDKYIDLDADFLNGCWR